MLTVPPDNPRLFRLVLTAFALLVAPASASAQHEVGLQWAAIEKASEVRGGLMVVVGAQEGRLAVEAVRYGPLLAQVLDRDPAAIDRLRPAVELRGIEGLVSIDRLDRPGRLPYAENLVNLLVLGPISGGPVPLDEAFRVLCPGGVLLAVSDPAVATHAGLQAAGLIDVKTLLVERPWILARKPWPKAMDPWSHPRHGPDGNAVSHDALVGPPRRVRWIAGPAQEISNMVTAAGRNYHAGVLARDSFNGLRLWERALHPSPARGGFSSNPQPGSVRPVADGQRLLVVSDDKVLALDGATGRTLREYPEAGRPVDLLVAGGLLIAVEEQSVRAVDAASGGLRWKHPAREPRCVVADQNSVYLIEGQPRRGESPTAVALDLAKGTLRWQRADWPWLAGVRACVHHGGLLAYEVSTLSDDKPNNRVHVVSAADGSPQWSRDFVPGMAHMKQARAMFAGDRLWVLDDRKCTAFDPKTGLLDKSFPAGWGHCFPPVATETLLFAGEMDLTDLATGRVDANRITKGACGRDAGLVPANGLIYTFPKHCVCWPMLRDYAALAPARAGVDLAARAPQVQDFAAEKGPAEPPSANPADAAGADRPADWPCYRHDAWRSASTTARVPDKLKILWQADLDSWPTGPIADDWRHNSFVRGPVTAPVSAGGLVFVARSDRHQVVALDAASGQRRWAFTAVGRIDTAPTIHRGLCLFGTRSGWVYCLRADDGRLVWRLRAAPMDEQIVAYGQLESPWPVPGSVLVVDGLAYFAAGRQPLADGGVRVFAVEPATGRVRWVQRLDSVPQTEFYAASGLEFESFDLLRREGQAVALSRWLFDLGTGRMTCDAKNGFARLGVGGSDGSSAMVPRGCWSYGPRYESEQVKDRPFVDPLVVFRGDTLFGCLQDRQTVFRRDFRLDAGEKFDAEWFNKWTVQEQARKGGDLWRSQRLARGAAWSVPTSTWFGAPARVSAMVLTPDALLIVGQAGNEGSLAAVSPKDGRLLSRLAVPSPLWDGLAASGDRLLLTTQDGKVLCLGAQ